MLEELLASLTPKVTALLPNYPNPFNPETWIPFQLASPADVRITIYAADGKLVRTLEFGHQPVGIYRQRSRAAYWDGRNALGEPRGKWGLFLYTFSRRFHGNAENADKKITKLQNKHKFYTQYVKNYA